MKIAIFSGSFDPIHEGHISLIKKANELFELVYIVVSINPHKTYKNTLTERVENVKETLIKHNINNPVIENPGLTIDIAKKVKAKYMIRGIRNLDDLKFELELANENQKLDNKIETIIFMSDPDKVEISSTSINKK